MLAGVVWFTRVMRLAGGLVTRALVGMVVGVVAVRRSWDASALHDRPIVVLLALAITVLVSLVVRVAQERMSRPGSIPALIGVVQFAIYCCVPETDQIPQVVAAVVVLIALEISAARTMPWWLIVAVFGLVLWSGLFGATGRDSALVGTLFATWPLVLVLVGVLAGVGSPRVDATVGSIAAVAVARTGGLEPTVRPALVAVVVAAVVSMVVFVSS